MDDQVEKIQEVSGKSLDKPKKVVTANQDYFDSLMQQQSQKVAETKPTTITEEVKKPSLLDQVSDTYRKVENISKPSPDTLIAQSRETIDRINRIKETLATTQDSGIKASYQDLLRNKLSHIDESLQIALSKAGVEYTSEVKSEPKGLLSPIEKYMGYLTQSQDQLMNLSTQIEELHNNNKELSPATMLSIQIKVGYIQQELEFFTSLLNKALESTKTLMNVQV